MPVIEKEVIRPGTYFYTDAKTGAPRKLVVTADMCRRWHDEGNKMLGLGLTVPVPFEHDFDAHPMTPKDKLLNNSGWIKGYKLKGDALFGELDIQDDAVAKKLPRTVRWTSPWINSFVDGNGRKWDNVISHLALTTRPRIVNQEPFPSIAAALSMATPADGKAGDGGYCLSRAGLLRDDAHPAYPIALSMWTGTKLSADDVREYHRTSDGKFSRTSHDAETQSIIARKAAYNAHYMAGGVDVPESKHADDATRKAARSMKDEDHAEAAEAHRKAASAHGKASLERFGGHHHAHNEAKHAHERASEHHHLASQGHHGGSEYNPPRPLMEFALGTDGKPPLKGKAPAADGKAGADGVPPGSPPDVQDTDEDNEEEEVPDGDEANPLANPLADAKGDIGMEELLCDLLQALGVPMPDESNEQEFRRHLYEAVMSKIKELTSKGMAGNEQKPPPPDQNKPPDQQPNASSAKKAPPNPLIPQVQQEQQPMYMSLDDINKIEDTTMRTVALSMFQQNQELAAKLEAQQRVTNAMRDAELAKETKKRQTRVAMLSRLSPKVKDHLEAMLSQQSMALSLGADGTVVDPMRATLDTLEAGLSALPSMLTADRSALSVAAQPTDEGMLSAEGEQKIVDDMARMMGAPAGAN